MPNLVEAPRAFLALFILAGLCYALALWRLPAAGDGRAVTGLVLAVALLARAVLLPVAPTLSTDAYRYLWDARVARAGISPYAHPPVAPELAHLRDDRVFPRLNHPTWHTIYPPGAQAFFRAVGGVAPDSLGALKVALGAAELLALGLLLAMLRRQGQGQPVARLAVYAWNPLVLVEVWGTAHLDALVLPVVVGALAASLAGRTALTGALLGAGTLVKLYPAALLPVLLGGPGTGPRGRVAGGAAFAAVVAGGYLPFLVQGIPVLGSLPRYLREERFNPGLTRSLVDEPVLVGAVLTAWVIGCGLLARRAPLAERAVWLAGGMLVLGPNVFPWYALWLVPFLALAPAWPWIAFTGAVGFAYAFFIPEPWAIPGWARAVELAPLAAGALGWALGRAGGGRVSRPA